MADPEGETDKPAPSWRPQKRSGEGNCGGEQSGRGWHSSKKEPGLL